MSLFWETRRACFSIVEGGLSVKQNRLDFPDQISSFLEIK